MSLRAVRPLLLPIALAASLVAPAFAQQGAPAAKPPTAEAPVKTAVIDFKTRVGSFKIVSPSSTSKARGAITMNFTGTVLVVGLEGTTAPGAGIRQEYDDAKQGRRAFFGTGTLTVQGKWRAIQFFGRNFSGHWDGYGLLRLYGEFDDKLETGTYSIKGAEQDEAWGTGGRTLSIPPISLNVSKTKPKVEDVKKKPGS